MQHKSNKRNISRKVINGLTYLLAVAVIILAIRIIAFTFSNIPDYSESKDNTVDVEAELVDIQSYTYDGTTAYYGDYIGIVNNENMVLYSYRPYLFESNVPNKTTFCINVDNSYDYSEKSSIILDNIINIGIPILISIMLIIIGEKLISHNIESKVREAELEYIKKIAKDNKDKIVIKLYK